MASVPALPSCRIAAKLVLDLSFAGVGRTSGVHFSCSWLILCQTRSTGPDSLVLLVKFLFLWRSARSVAHRVLTLFTLTQLTCHHSYLIGYTRCNNGLGQRNRHNAAPRLLTDSLTSC